MKTSIALLLLPLVSGFLPQTSQRVRVVVLKMGYVPDGISPDEYKKLKQKEMEEAKKKKFGAFGPQSFKSRSLQSFQKDLETGKAGHLLPVFNAKEKVKKGEIKPSDIPYMQRGGAWDNSDVKGAKKKGWNDVDKKYNANEKPGGLDWMGVGQRAGPPQQKAAKKQEPPKKKLFGLF